MSNKDQPAIAYFDVLDKLPKQDELKALLVDKTLNCIRIKNVFPISYAKELSLNAISRSRPHDRLQGLIITGNTYYQSAEEGKISDEYFHNPETFATWVRQVSNGLSPLDAIIGIFSSMHRLGISPAALENARLMPPAIFRIYPANNCTEILPHQDVLHWYTDSEIARSLDGQVGWNIYLDVPSEGGELLLYNNRLNQQDYENLAQGNYGIPWEVAGNPIVSIKPDIGELILIDTHRLHAIKGVLGQGFRITLSGFLGYSESRSLMTWA